MSKIIFITGSSSGLGKETAKQFAQQGWNVVATMRTPEKETELTTYNNVKLLKLDVTDAVQVKTAVQQAIAVFGRIDVVVNNAGVGMYGALELMEEKDIDEQFAVNVRGVINIIRGFLPHFRENGGGMFINISSVMGRSAAVPLGSLYNMSKFALEGLIEGLYFEMKHLNIELKLIEPGGFYSSFKNNIVFASQNNIAVYDALTKKVRQGLEAPLKSRQKGTLPAVVALVYQLATHKKKSFRTVVGLDGQGVIMLRKLMPINWFLAFLRKYFKLDKLK